MSLIANKRYLIFIFLLSFSAFSCVVRKSLSEDKNIIFYEKVNINLVNAGSNYNLNGFIFDFDSYVKVVIQNEMGITFLALKIYNDSIKSSGLLSENFSDLELSRRYRNVKIKDVLEKLLRSKIDPKIDEKFLFANGIVATQDNENKINLYNLNRELYGSIEYIKNERHGSSEIPVKFNIFVSNYEFHVKTTKMKIYRWE